MRFIERAHTREHASERDSRDNKHTETRHAQNTMLEARKKKRRLRTEGKRDSGRETETQTQQTESESARARKRKEARNKRQTDWGEVKERFAFDVIAETIEKVRFTRKKIHATFEGPGHQRRHISSDLGLPKPTHPKLA